MGLFGMAGRAQKRKEKLKRRIDAQDKEKQEEDIYTNYGEKKGGKKKKNFRQGEEQEAIEELQKHQPGMKQLSSGGMNPKKQDRPEGGPKKQQTTPAQQGTKQVGGKGLGKPLTTAYVDPPQNIGPTKKQEEKVTQKSVEVKAAQSRKGKKKGFKEEGDALLERYKEKLQGSTFRLLNEELYRSPNSFVAETLRDPRTYNDYHEGYRVQMGQWPVTPTELIVEGLVNDKRGRFLAHKEKHIPGHVKNQKWVIADMGAGDCAIAKTLVTQHGAAIGRTEEPDADEMPSAKGKATEVGAFTIHSFDLCADNEYATAADMANVPLGDNSTDCAIFCLSLMATDYDRYIKEAHRILKQGKLLKIVEVRSRLPNPKQFAELVETIGFKCDWWDVAANYFVMFDFVKINSEQQEQQEKDAAASNPTGRFEKGNKYGGKERNSSVVQNMALQEILAPCVYKRR